MSGRAPDTLTRTDDWAHRAACKGDDTDDVFYNDRHFASAKARCSGCPVREQCLADAMDWESKRGNVRYGVYGGLTANEREELAAGKIAVTGRKGAACPSEAAYNRHVRLGEPIDDGCRRAHNEAARAYTAQRKARV